MLEHLFFIITVSLFDSFSTTQQIIVFVMLLTTANPVRNSLVYLAALSGSYFLCGILGYMGFDALHSFVTKFLSFNSNVPDPIYYQSQIIAGLIFVIIGIVYYVRKKRSVKPMVEHIIITRLRNMPARVAALIGLIISVGGFPMSLPYIAALGKFATLDLTLIQAMPYILIYNIFYALPMIAIFGFYMLARGKHDDMEERLHERARKLNYRLTSVMFVTLGLFSVADSAVYFILGHPILKGRYF